MKSWIMLGLLSFSAFADSGITLAPYEKYKSNFQMLSSDLVKLEALAQKGNNPLYAQMLKDMTYFKTQYDHIASPLRLEDLYLDAKDNGWPNVQKMSKTLIPTCETPVSYNITLCKNGLEEMKTFVMNSKLSNENKDGIVSFVDDYTAQVQALYTLNGEFVERFNRNAEAVTNFKIVPPPIKVEPVINSEKIPSPAVAATAEENVGLIKVFEDMQSSSILYAAFIGMILAAFFGAQAYRKKKAQKAVKAFYTKLFTLASKANIQMKVFGKLTKNELKVIESVQMNFLNTLYFSRVVAPKAEVRFKNKKHELSIEMNFPTSRSIQTVLSNSSDQAFKKSLEKLQTSVESDGGEVVYSNRFNAFGEIIQSALIIHIPKA